MEKRKLQQKKHRIDIENFEKIKQLKESNFSTIWSIRDINTQQIYAAKVMKPGMYEQNKAINREIAIMTLFQHPTIIKFYGYSLSDFDKNHSATIIMDLAKNGSLSDLLGQIRNKKTPEKYNNTARQIILAGIARGMMFLHKNNVIHRDLRTENILLDEYFHPHITDFGLSKTYEAGTELFLSKPNDVEVYMAPELLLEQKYNGKVDVYSFGIIMYEVLTEDTPYKFLKKNKIDKSEFKDKITKQNLRPEFKTNIKKSLRRLIERCWSKDPTERPTFEEIFNKLAFNNDILAYDIYDDSQDGNGNGDNDENSKYYLEDIDVDEYLYYINSINEGDTNDENNPSLAIINDLKKENEELRKQINAFSEQISELTRTAKTMKERLNEKIEEQSKINEQNLEKIKTFKKEIRSLKKRLQPKDNTSDLLIDLTKYKKGKVIHQSTICTTYKATPLESKATKKDKIIVKSYQGNGSIQEDSFVNDIKILSQLRSAALLPLIGYSIPTNTDDKYSIIFPFMINGDLSQLISKVSKRKGPKNWETIRAINIFGIAIGMAYLHEKNIIHTDLNLSSILLNEDYQPKIGRIHLSSLPEREIPTKGKAYLAPEYINKQQYSNKVDVYSYAFILFSLFSLQNPKDSSFMSTQVLFDSVPPQYEELIQSCLSEQADDRPTFSQITMDFIENKEKYFGIKNVEIDAVFKYIDEASFELFTNRE